MGGGRGAGEWPRKEGGGRRGWKRGKGRIVVGKRRERLRGGWARYGLEDSITKGRGRMVGNKEFIRIIQCGTECEPLKCGQFIEIGRIKRLI